MKGESIKVFVQVRSDHVFPGIVGGIDRKHVRAGTWTIATPSSLEFVASLPKPGPENPAGADSSQIGVLTQAKDAAANLAGRDATALRPSAVKREAGGKARSSWNNPRVLVFSLQLDQRRTLSLPSWRHLPRQRPLLWLFKKRRRIFPDLVFGNDATNSNERGSRDWSSSRRTCSINAADNAWEAT